MDKSETREIENLISAYHKIGSILLDRLREHVATTPKALTGPISTLRAHTSLIHHLISGIHANLIADVPHPNRDKYEVELGCPIHFIVEGVKTRQDAVGQVESGYYDEYIGTLIAEATKKGRFRKVERIRPIDEEEDSGA